MGYKSKLKQMKRSGQSIIPAIDNNAWEELCTSYTRRETQAEDYWLSMRKECDAIVKNKYDIQSSYQAARVLLYETLLEERDNLEQDCSTSKKVDVNIRKAGEMLYASGGMNYLHDPLLWSFIPRHIRRHIDYIWSGIGDWLA
jgi:hypothetical protein